MNFLPFDIEGVINKSEGAAPFATESISMIGESDINSNSSSRQFGFFP